MQQLSWRDSAVREALSHIKQHKPFCYGLTNYMTGIEPGTSYAYPVTIEREQKRVKQLQPGASTAFDLTYTLLHSRDQVTGVRNRIEKIQGETKVDEIATPMAKE